MTREKIAETLINLTRGSYQVGLIEGWEAWSGARLRGRAKSWGGRYQASSTSLLRRAREVFPEAATDYRLLETKGTRRWCRVLVVPTPQGEELFGYPVR